jgi:hypothetical protein
MTSSHPVVLFYSPYAGLWPHALPEALVAGALQRNGAEVVYAVCDGMYSEGCIVMSAYRLSGDSDATARERVCRRCRKQRDLLAQQLGVRTVVIDSLLDAQSTDQIRSIVNEVTIDNLETFLYEGFPIGRYAIHETIIHHKLTSLSEMTEAAVEDFRLKLKHVLRTIFVGEKLLELVSPDRIVMYNTHISTNFALMNLTEKAGIPTFGLHAGGNMSDRFATLYVFRKDMVVLFQDWMRRFIQNWNALPTTAQGIRNATIHFLALTTGQTVWVYSAPKSAKHFDVREYFGIKPKQKVLLATLSSYDELYSSQMMGVMDTYPLIFSNQVEWIREVISFVKQREDLFLIIRVHPRELPNLRDAVHSRHAQMLADELKELPKNVRVNWPSDGISLYDLIPLVDVGLNGWSSAGKELAMLGVPVVIYTKDILFYPHTLNLLAKDRSNYFECIEKALAEGWSFERAKQVYRWLAVEYTLGTLSINDKFVLKEGARSFWRRAFNRLKRIITQRFEARKVREQLREEGKLVRSIMEDASIVDLQLNEQTRLSDEEEMTLLREEMGKILSTVYPNTPIGYSNTIDNLRGTVSGGR